MYKICQVVLLLVICNCSFSQSKDSLGADKWTNYKRPRGVGDDYVHSLITKKYITDDGDTLERSLYISAEFNQVLEEASLLHGKKNGLSISYYPNGVIKEISYYLNGKLWDVISRADSTGKLLNPGDLHNGNGVRFFAGFLGIEANCYETYKDGLPDGPFYWQPDLKTCVKGELSYKPSVVQFIPAKRVTYVGPSGEKTTATFDTSVYRQIFQTEGSLIGFKILSVSNDSLPERPRDYKYININFDDPAIIPRGVWEVFYCNSNKKIWTVTYDNNGNPIKAIQYKENGEIFSEKSFPTFGTRKW